MEPEDIVTECPFRDAHSPDFSNPDIDMLVRLGICTKDCPYREHCIVERISFMIYANVFQVRKIVIEEIDKFPAISIQFDSFMPDEYLNELTGVVD